MRSGASALRLVRFLFSAAALPALAAPCAFAAPPSAPAPKPNFLFILADDLGKNGVGVCGAERVRTPHIDRLADRGMRFDNHYVMPVCMPTRAVLHTGRWGFRTGLPTNMSSGWSYPGDGVVSGGRVLSPAEVTVPEILGAAGYATALVGKYHLGFTGLDDPATRGGWDRFYGYPAGTLPSYENPPLIADGRALGAVPGNATDLYTEEAIRWLKAQRDRPFCLWLCHNAPHGPDWAPERFREPYRDVPEPMGSYYAMMAHLDESVGRVLQALDDLGLARNTLVVFMSDNGADRKKGGDKGSVSDRGTRVPLIARWPGRIAPGGVTRSLTNAADILPTFAGAAGAPLPAGRTIDGVSLLPLFADPAREVREFSLVYWRNRFAIRRGDLKLVTPVAEDAAADVLYDLSKDPGEATDAIGDPAYAEPLQALRAIASRYREEARKEGAGTATDEGPPRVPKKPKKGKRK